MFERNLRKLVQIIKGRGSIPLVVTEPSLYKEKMTTEEIQRLWMGQVLCNSRNFFIFEEYPSFLSLHRAMKTFSQIVKTVAASEGVNVVDAEASIEKDLNHFVDDVHQTELGVAKLGKIVATQIVKRNFID